LLTRSYPFMNETPTMYMSTHGVSNDTTYGIQNLLAASNTVTMAANNMENVMAKSARRIVRIIISDNHEDILLTNTVLYDSGEITTDQTDQELYFDLDMKGLLEKHNATRTATLDTEYPESTVYLEAARIRDLNMTVITIAAL